MFDWLRLKVRNAVLAGINDAVANLETQGANNHDDAEAVLAERLQITHNRGVEEVESKPARGRKG